jgi:putative hydrolase of the HAD superfamily
MPYQNIIFDLGGVIINIDYRLSVREFAKLSSGILNEIELQNSPPSFIIAYEKGEISSNQFRDAVRKEFHITATDQQIDAAWNAMLLDIPQERLFLIRKLSKHKRLFVLSNTNQIHKAAFDKKTQAFLGDTPFDDLFEKAYYSYQIQMSKPDSIIFELVLNQNKLIPHQTLFIDDTKKHLLAAQQIGITTYHLQAPETITDLFNREMSKLT